MASRPRFPDCSSFIDDIWLRILVVQELSTSTLQQQCDGSCIQQTSGQQCAECKLGLCKEGPAALADSGYQGRVLTQGIFWFQIAVDDGLLMTEVNSDCELDHTTSSQSLVSRAAEALS